MPNPDSSPDIEVSVYDRIGGHETVRRLVDAFYAAMDRLPVARGIRAMHDADLSETRRVLVLFLSQWLGGPGRYAEERGHPMLRRRHFPFSIGDAERDAWMACMREALSETIDDPAIREQLAQAFQRTADHMRNQGPF